MRSFEKSAWWSVGLLLLAHAAAMAQEVPPPVTGDSIPTQTGPATLISGMPAMGIYAAPFSRFGHIRNQLAVYPGMRLGVVLGRSLAVGVSGGILANHVALDTIPGNDMSLKYAGLELEGLIFPQKVINGSLRVLGGAGLLSAGPAPAGGDGGDGGDSGGAAAPALAPAEKILLIEPGAELTVNVSAMLRLSAGWSYRLVRGIDSTMLTNDDLSGWLGSFTIRIAMY